MVLFFIRTSLNIIYSKLFWLFLYLCWCLINPRTISASSWDFKRSERQKRLTKMIQKKVILFTVADIETDLTTYPKVHCHFRILLKVQHFKRPETRKRSTTITTIKTVTTITSVIRKKRISLADQE